MKRTTKQVLIKLLALLNNYRNFKYPFGSGETVQVSQIEIPERVLVLLREIAGKFTSTVPYSVDVSTGESLILEHNALFGIGTGTPGPSVTLDLDLLDQIETITTSFDVKGEITDLRIVNVPGRTMVDLGIGNFVVAPASEFANTYFTKKSDGVTVTECLPTSFSLFSSSSEPVLILNSNKQNSTVYLVVKYDY